jgi:cytochrome c oxidase assembly protein subunit 15
MAEKRKIFEDVGAGARAPAAPAGGMIDKGKRGGRGPVRRWLAVLFALVVVMIAVGGLTRLTDAGLSITEWNPASGSVPPMSAADWEEEFAKYRATEEFRLQNSAMTLAEFKRIYWWEWGHRQLGRTIGLVWAAGFAFFWATGRIPAGWTGRLVLVGALGGLQGALGWWMVKSGFGEGMVDVSSYRLALHLGLAFVILALIAWYILMLARPAPELLQMRRQGEPRLAGLATGLMHLTILQVLIGALVAGIDAGRGFPTWPLMNGSFFPADAFYVPDGGAAWRAFFENPGLVQFVHRIVAYLLLIYGVFVLIRSRRSAHPETRSAFALAVGMLVVQAVLGIVTALYAAPLALALLHQFGAVVLVTLVVRARHRARYPVVQGIRGARA